MNALALVYVDIDQGMREKNKVAQNEKKNIVLALKYANFEAFL